MGYIIKVVSENIYLTAGEDSVITTDSRQEAIENGQFYDYESAKETAETWSGHMVLGRDFIIEKII